ncbi:putative reverse transcriptase domain-containing protein [Tanacetum coccineum]
MKRLNMFVDMDTELVKESSKKAEMEQESSSKRAGEELESDNSKKQKLDESVEVEVDDEAEMKNYMEIVFDDEKLVKAKHGNIRPEEAYERVLWGDLKVMFEPDIESDILESAYLYAGRKKYPLIPATITAMLNKKLQADHWNEMCYQLLKLMTKQITTVRRVSTVRRIKTREMIKMKIVYQDYLRDKYEIFFLKIFGINNVPLLGEEGLLSFVCKMRKSSRNKTRAMENLNFFYQDIGTSSSAGGHLTQEEEAKEALGIRMSQKFALLEEERPIIETIAYHAKVNKNALADTGSDINTMPYWIYEQLGREDMKKVDRRITMINHTQAEAMGILTNVICQVGVTTLIAKFPILDILIDRDSPIVVGRGFLRTISGIVNTPERLFSTFDRFCHQTFRAASSDVMRNA